MAKTDIETLTISLEARISSYERSLKKAQETTNRHLKAIEDRATKAGGGISKGLTNSLKEAEQQAATSGAAISAALSRGLKGAGAAVITNEIRKMADAWQEATNKIRAAGASGTSLDQIVDIAQRSRAELAPTVDLYARLTRSAADLGASQAEIAVATEAVAKGLKISGASAQETSGALIQLSQALQSGRLQGDELRSLLENAPVLVRAIAKEFGVAVGELKTLGSEGRLVSDRVFKALVDSAAEVNTAFAKTEATNRDYWTNLQTAATQYVGHSSTVAGATSLINAGIEGLTNNFALLGDGAIALGAILAARLVAAGLKPLALQIGMVATQFMTATPAIAATNVALVATAQRATAAAMAARVLSGALALVGGVPGAIILGVGAAALYASSQMKDGAQEAQQYADALDRVREKGEGATDAVKGTGDAVVLAARQQAKAQTDEIQKGMAAANDAIAEAGGELDKVQRQLKALARTPVRIAPEIAMENLERYGVESREHALALDADRMAALQSQRSMLQGRLESLSGRSGIGAAATDYARRGFERQIEETSKRIAEIEDQIANFKPHPAIEAIAPATSAIGEAAAQIDDLLTKLRDGLITVDKFELELSNIGKANPALAGLADAALRLSRTIAGATASLKEYNEQQEKANKLEAEAREKVHKREMERQGRIAMGDPRVTAPTLSFENAQIEGARKSAEAKEIEAEAQRILNEAKKKGIEYTEQQAGALAKETIEAKKALQEAEALKKKGFLDLIGYAEGTDKARGYNETLGYGKFSGGDRTLVTMTIGQIKQLQAEMLAHPDNKFNSSAVGRYQITRRTLIDLQKRLDISDDDYFNPSMQDRLALDLMRRRGRNTAGLRNEWEGFRKVDEATILAAFDRQSISMPAVDESVTEKNKALEEQKKAYADINTEAERYIERQSLEAAAVGKTELQARAMVHTFELLNEAKRAGIEITPELERHYEQLGQKMAAADVGADELRKRFDELNDTARFFGGEAVDALSGLITGTTTAEQALQSLIQTLVRATLQAALLGEGPLASLFGGSGGKGGLLGGFLGSVLGVKTMHSGGVVGLHGRSGVAPAALFAGAPRYHSGGVAGLKPDEIPAILQRGEYVVSRANMMAAAMAGRGGAGRAPTVNVNNFGPTTPEVQVSRSGDSYSIDVVIPALENAMAARASRGHGSLGKAVTSSATGRTLRG
ncbi:tape measure protein [Pseudochelatococcus sp. B33]